LFVAVHESGCGTKLPKLVGQSMSALPGNSDIDLFRYGQGVINLDAEVSGGAFDLGVAEQELHRPQVTSSPVDQGRFGPSGYPRLQPPLEFQSAN
jgi:hypothetical protein